MDMCESEVPDREDPEEEKEHFEDDPVDVDWRSKACDNDHKSKSAWRAKSSAGDDDIILPTSCFLNMNKKYI